MSLWEYKHITSGPHGFATPALLESYLNQLGKDEWEIISYETLSNNALAFNGVARRTTLRDWTLESAAAAAAKIEAEKLRAEFAAKFAGNATGAAGDAHAEKPSTLVSETAAPEDGFRKLRDTERDADPDAAEEGDDWDNWDNLDDDLPTFFEAIKPHLRKNQRGPGQSVGVTFLAKRWEQSEGDLIGALKECGFVIPEREDDAPVHLEFEGELYWLNLNNRHELFLNTREKPRPVFRVAQAKPLDPSDPTAVLLAGEASAEQAEKAKREADRVAREAEQAARRAEHEARRLAQQAAAQAAREAAQAAAAARAAKLTEDGGQKTEDGPKAEDGEQKTDGGQAEEVVTVSTEELPPEAEEFLAAVRAQMRRNRRGPGYSGSITYLARAFKQSENDLVEMFIAVGLTVPETANDKPVKTAIGEFVYWLNKDSRNAIWINGDEVRAPRTEDGGRNTEDGEQKAEDGAPAVETAAMVEPITQDSAVVESAPEAAPELALTETPAVPAEAVPFSGDSALAGIRLLLNPNKRGTGVSAEVGYLAKTLGQDLQHFLVVISELGLALPATEEHKPTFVEHADEIFWLNKNPKDGSVWINAKTSKAGAKKAAGSAAAKPKAKKAPRAAE
ncbi:hypothetical protein [Rariglobus hedericola]|uniref:DUF4177 domain-containing protein n=1 Tax=Rariglobus hedericola TaxID=2597822 RepID=A0A556QS20_9BACT|nr:hypothetical protein [Rariglobus hedericola]TSJ79431.1 hypothetical protein FPL22_09125 [Rariglobus hedericola]